MKEEDYFKKMEDKIKKDSLNLLANKKVDGMSKIGYNNDLTSNEVQTNAQAQDLLEKSKPEYKMSDKMAGAIGDVAGSLTGPTKTIDMGQYSAVAPTDEMAKLRMQVLEQIRNRQG